MKYKFDLEFFYGFYYNPWNLDVATVGFVVFENKKVIDKQFLIINVDSYKDFTKHILSYKSLLFCLDYVFDNQHKDKKLAFYTNSLVVNRQLQSRLAPEKGEHVGSYIECINKIENLVNPVFGYLSRKNNQITISYCKENQKKGKNNE